ncbi:hypothetical protein C8F01DRAFT_1263874 [Mycena amicta]|nr:hypothetical protein C8F01DRAFT_1263874 [Mycena amicta]
MAAPSLPNELISEILSPVLRVPDALFSDTSRVSPFADYALSSSNYLLAGKGWLRVGTPLLYHTVVIRSMDQARALARIFSENEDADLGRFVKKLCIESGYGTPIRVIFQNTRNLTDLPTTLILGDISSFILQGPSSFMPGDPSTLSSEKSAESKLTAKLANGISAAILGWKNLTTVSYNRLIWEEKISRPLAKSARLTTLFVRSVYEAEKAHTLFVSCPLRTIHILNTISEFIRQFLEQRPALQKLVKCTIESTQPVDDELLPSLNPFYIPMAAAAQDVTAELYCLSTSSIQYEPLIRVHGAKLIELDIDHNAMRGISVPVLDLCPNMTTLVLRTPTPSSINLLPASSHATHNSCHVS